MYYLKITHDEQQRLAQLGIVTASNDEGDFICPAEHHKNVKYSAVVTVQDEQDETESKLTLSDLKNKRDALLGLIAYELADGSKIQARPQDAQNLKVAIENGESQQWLMADDTVRVCTVAELQAAFDYGKAEAKRIWGSFFDEYETLYGIDQSEE
jgi:hypothetical protein